MKRIDKVVSFNLMGEDRQAEKHRLLKARIKAIANGIDRDIVHEMRRGKSLYLAGTTDFQVKKRRKSLSEAGVDPLHTHISDI